MRPPTSSSSAVSPSVPRLSGRRSSQSLLRCAVFLPLLLFLSTTTFIRNLPFHVSPPSLPAHCARFPSSSSSSSASLHHTTLHSLSSLSPSTHLAFCEDALLFRPSSPSSTANTSDLALLSCDPSRRVWNTVMGPLSNPYAGEGGLWVLEPGRGEVRRVEVQWEELQEGRVEFHPLGIEVERTEEGEDKLFVVNHRANQSTIEIFTLSRSSAESSPLAFTATHLTTLSHASFTGAPNSLAAYSDNSFFLSHDHRFNRRSSSLFARLANAVETIFALPLSGVDFVRFDLRRDGGEAKVEVERVLSGIAFANGLALSPTKDTLVVASTTRRQLLFYRIHPSPPPSAAPRLDLIRTVSLPFLVDNLSLLPSSPSSSPEDRGFTVLAAGHPSYPALLSAAHRLSLSLSLPSPLASLFRALGLEKWAEGRVRYDWREQDGGSWVVAVPHPHPPPSSAAAGEDREEWRTVFQSHGRPKEGGFGGSTTAVIGGGEGGRWMVVTGLYADGVRVVREVEPRE